MATLTGDPSTIARAERFVRACRRQTVDRTPVWLMRQAGRALPAYRELRSRYAFLDLIKQPELLAEVTLLPLDVLDVDAAIMFADITLPLASIGVRFDIVETIGPVIAEPVRDRSAVRALGAPTQDGVREVTEGVAIVRRALDGKVPVIGFAGGPFTMACYLVEGRPSREFVAPRALMLSEPETWHELMDRLTVMTIAYLRAKVAAGAQAVQLFDSWLGILSPRDVERSVQPYSDRIFEALSDLGVPRISFATGTAGSLEVIATAPCEVVGVDHRVPLDVAWSRIGSGKAIQGNLDPVVAMAPRDVVLDGVRDVLRRAAGRPGHIFNLGHGVLPETPVEHLRLIVDTVHTETA